MAETKLPRLLAAAKEFNVGQETLVDFLISKGFSKDELKPTSKLSEDMYRSLQQEFQGDMFHEKQLLMILIKSFVVSLITYQKKHFIWLVHYKKHYKKPIFCNVRKNNNAICSHNTKFHSIL